MKTKHTPGKWSIDGIDIVSENGNSICQVYDADDTHISEMNMDVVKANAKLIAAAPELLKSLQECVKAMKIVTSSAIKPFIERAEQAIKKATE